MQLRSSSRLPLIGVFAIIYVIAGKIGLNLASLHASASPVWPPAGIGLAAILLLGYRAWPAIFVGAFLVNLTTAGDIATSVAIATGNTVEAIAGAWLVNRFAGGKNVFDSWRCFHTSCARHSLRSFLRWNRSKQNRHKLKTPKHRWR